MAARRAVRSQRSSSVLAAPAGSSGLSFTTTSGLTIGNNSTVTGLLNFQGVASGAVTIKPQSAAGSYNFNLPTTAGSAGQALLSAGGGSSPMTWGSIAVPQGGTGLAALTTGSIYMGAGTANIAPSALSDNGTLVSSSESFDVTTDSYVIELGNAGTTGTTLNKLVKVSSTGKALIAATTDTSGIIGVAVGGAGTSGNAQIAVAGTATCVFDGTAAAGDYIGISSGTAGDCTDVGSALPTSGENIGRVLVGGSGAGTYTLMVNPGSTYITNNSSGSSGNVQTSNGSGGFNNFALPLLTAQGGTGLTSPGANGNFLQSNGTSWVSAIGTTSTGTGVPAGSLGQVQFNATGGNFGALKTFYVQGYGAVCDGSTDDTTAIQTAMNAANAAGGGTIIFPPGTCISQTLTLNNFEQLRGGGINATVLKLKTGTNADMIIGANYNSWHGSNTAYGVGDWSIEDMTLDGNKANNTASASVCGSTTGTSDGLKVYGYEFYTNRVAINNFAGCGWYTEWSNTAGCPYKGTSGSTVVPDCMEAHVNDLKLADNAGPVAFDWAGPHDSKLSYLFAIQNAGEGFLIEGNGNAVDISNAHSYSNGFAFDIETAYVYCDFCYADGGQHPSGTIFVNGGIDAGSTPDFVLTNSIAGMIILGQTGQTCGNAPYKMWMTNNTLGVMQNYASCGFQDIFLGNTVSVSTSVGLGAYAPDTAYGNIGLQDRTYNSYQFNGSTTILGSSGTSFQMKTNAIQTFLANSSGQVEIGTSTPVSGATLSVSGDTDLAASHYLNWGVTDGIGGYGLRDSGGNIQFKHNGGSWTSLSNAVTWPTSGYVVVSNGTSAPTGVKETDGLCLVGASGAWGAGSCAGLSSLNLGVTTTATSPQISGDPSSGFYTAGAGLVDIAVSGVKMIEWSSVGEVLEHALNVVGKITYGGPVNVHVNTVTTGATYNVSATTDYFVCINKGTGSATAVTLPSSPNAGDLYIIKDCKGDASSHNITVSASGGSIDGASSLVISTNYGLQGFVATSSTTWAAE